MVDPNNLGGAIFYAGLCWLILFIINTSDKPCLRQSDKNRKLFINVIVGWLATAFSIYALIFMWSAV